MTARAVELDAEVKRVAERLMRDGAFSLFTS